MASPGRIPSSPPKGASLQEELAYYKSQYEQVEFELQEFQNSSKELEAELEKDVEEAEKRERALKEKAEALRFEVEEWKEKYRQAKAEANNAQATLQKEITTLRDTNRTLQFKVRDIEVQNDDFERQARNQTSSLEDLESKYNVSIERGVLMEEEMRIGEQEREALRIENQRVRDEYSELKVEAEILQGKLKHAEGIITKNRERRTTPLSIDSLRPPSPMSEASTSVTTTSSPSISTPPPTKSETSTLQTSPPSPAMSNGSGVIKRLIPPITPVPNKTRSMAALATPRLSGIRPPRHSRGPSVSTPATTRTGIPITPRVPTARLSVAQERPNTSSRSLNQIRGLIGRMQKLEERVHTTRSKLPAPTSTPPRSSPRNGDALASIPSTVTVRSARKRTSNSTAASSFNGDQPARPSSRLSFGFTPTQSTAGASSKADSISRPSSRASHTADRFIRPSSRASATGRTTPFADIPTHRPRSSISGNYATMHGVPEAGVPRSTTPGPRMSNHSFSRSVSAAVGHDGPFSSAPSNILTTPVTARRTTLERGGAGTGIPTPSGLTRRQSGGLGVLTSTGRRQSGTGKVEGAGDMRPPSRGLRRQMSEIGERY